MHLHGDRVATNKITHITVTIKNRSDKPERSCCSISTLFILNFFFHYVNKMFEVDNFKQNYRKILLKRNTNFSRIMPAGWNSFYKYRLQKKILTLIFHSEPGPRIFGISKSLCSLNVKKAVSMYNRILHASSD